MMGLEDKAEVLNAVFEYYGINAPSMRGKVLCPVHSEDRPSAVVDMSTGKWRCFACHAHGDALDIIQHREGVGYQDATRIAERILDESGRDVRAISSWQSSGRVSGRTRDRSSSRKYVPSWLRET